MLSEKILIREFGRTLCKLFCKLRSASWEYLVCLDKESYILMGEYVFRVFHLLEFRLKIRNSSLTYILDALAISSNLSLKCCIFLYQFLLPSLDRIAGLVVDTGTDAKSVVLDVLDRWEFVVLVGLVHLAPFRETYTVSSGIHIHSVVFPGIDQSILDRFAVTHGDRSIFECIIHTRNFRRDLERIEIPFESTDINPIFLL